MSKPLNWSKIKKPLFIGAVVIGGLWYSIFKWNSFDYLWFGAARCYCETNFYYITRHKTLWEKISRTYPDDYGTARLFDATGKMLYEGKTLFGVDTTGPFWFKNRVSMWEDNDGKVWTAPLKFAPGDERMLRECYPVKDKPAAKP